MANTPITALTHLTARYDKAVVGTDGCIVKEALTVDEGAGTIIGEAVGSIAFDADRGFYTTDGLGKAAINLAEANGGAGGLDDCKTAFTLYMEIETSAMQPDATIIGILDYIFHFRVNVTGDSIYLDPDNASGVRITGDLSGGPLHSYVKGSRHTGSHVPIVITRNGNNYHLYVDGYPVLKGGFITVAGSVTEFDIGGRGTTTFHGPTKAAIRNVAIWTRPFINPSTYGLKIASFGDSYAENGTYGHINLEGDINVEAADGSSGATFDGSTLMADDGMFPVCHAQLRKAGYGVNGNRILHWAEGGSGIVATGTAGDVGARIDEAITGKYPLPDYAVIVCGYNDLKVPVSDADLGDGTYAALYQAEVTKLTDLGITVIVCNLIWTGTASTNYTDARVKLLNAAIDTLTGCTVIDMYTLLYGNADAILPDNIHPSHIGQALYGKEIAKAILATL